MQGLGLQSAFFKKHKTKQKSLPQYLVKSKFAGMRSRGSFFENGGGSGQVILCFFFKKKILE